MEKVGVALGAQWIRQNGSAGQDEARFREGTRYRGIEVSVKPDGRAGSTCVISVTIRPSGRPADGRLPERAAHVTGPAAR
jgi:hypothetical protein